MEVPLTHPFLTLTKQRENASFMSWSTYSCSEFRNTLEVYSSRREVLERLRASLLGRENAKAVPSGD